MFLCDVKRNHTKTFLHFKRLERINILEKAEENNDLTCLIPLRDKNEDIISYTLVDTKVYKLIMNYAISISNGYAAILIGNNKHRLHRFIYYNLRRIIPNSDMIIDHKDRNPLNNTMKNIQEATFSENNRNRPKKVQVAIIMEFQKMGIRGVVN